uniref:Uncharacterized protein n=1 Tax=Tetraselmis chuii TaxID=63592 RepID=A0A7S1T3B4_9CHLO
MLRDITFSQLSVRAMPDEVEECQPATQGSRKRTASRGLQLWRTTKGKARREKAEVVTRKEASRYISARTRRALAGLSILLLEVECHTEENQSSRSKRVD